MLNSECIVDVTIEDSRILARNTIPEDFPSFDESVPDTVFVEFYYTPTGQSVSKIMFLTDLFRILAVASTPDGESTVPATSYNDAWKLEGFVDADNPMCSVLP